MTNATATNGSPHLPPDSELPDRPVRILVADDEYLVALDIVSQLGACGYTSVGPAPSGNEAVRLARSTRPDLALLDVRMPDGDGISAARTIFGELGIPVVMLSAYTDEATLKAARGAGVFAYLVKPAHANQLKATLEVAWGRFREFRAEKAGAEDARRRLDERKTIERAKWALVQRAGVDEATAMRMLEDHARSNNERLIAVAERVVRHGESALRLSGEEPPTTPPESSPPPPSP
ncbi:MAG: response regulator [Phycisphaerales bacterium]|nr:response regulator [Phycisphaerales bacterium]